METHTLVKSAGVKWWRKGLTQASICQAGSIRVYGNAVFTEIRSFKNTSVKRSGGELS
jgi:hypothetical protein